MTELIFRRAHFDDKGNFIKITDWGFIEGGFASPSSVYGEHREKAIDLQFIGIFDKDTVKVYNGDIIKPLVPFGCPFVISFDYVSYYASNVKIKDDIKKGGNQTYTLDALLGFYKKANAEFKVIGNIYQNPEYLK